MSQNLSTSIEPTSIRSQGSSLLRHISIKHTVAASSSRDFPYYLPTHPLLPHKVPKSTKQRFLLLNTIKKTRLGVHESLITKYQGHGPSITAGSLINCYVKYVPTIYYYQVVYYNLVLPGDFLCGIFNR